jgi:Na+-transporting methylmalonyl-CoA/oxaloacetate decarboxylase gamma subunit
MILTTFLEGLQMTIFAIVVVFILLELVTLSIEGLAKIQTKPKSEAIAASPVASSKAFRVEDFKDEDMMVAALVASIDYQEQAKTNVRVVSIKEVQQ